MMPLMPLTLAFVGGVVVSLTGLSPIWAYLGFSAALCAVLFRKYYMAVLVAMAAVGFVGGCVARPVVPDNSVYGFPHVYSGCIDNVVDGESVQTLYVSVDSVDGVSCTPFDMVVYEPSHEYMLQPAWRLGFRAIASMPKPYRDLPDEIDPADMLIERGIVAVAFMPPDSLLYISPERGFIPVLRRLSVRVASVIASSGLDDSASGLLIALLTGDRSLVGYDERDEFSKAGLAHLLALSGLHVGVLAWIVAIALYPLYLAGMRRTRLMATIVILWMFAAMTGFGTSVVRAVVMSTVFLVGEMFSQRRSPLNSLALAALIILVFRPLDITTPGFQMSFMAVLSILTVVPLLRRWLDCHARLYSLLMPFAVSSAAMISTGIVAAFHFHIFPVYFLLSNAVAAFLLPLILTGGIVLVLAYFLSIPNGWLVTVVDYLCDIVEWIACFVSGLPGAVVDGIYVSQTGVVLYLAALSFIIASFYVKRRRGHVVTVAMAIVMFAGFCISVAGGCDDSREAIWLTRNNRSTDIIVRSGNTLYLMTTARSVAECDAAVNRARYRYADYMRRRDIDSLIMAPDTFSTATINRRGHYMILADGRAIMILNDDNITIPSDCGDNLWALIVCRGFRGNVVDAARRFCAARVILSADLDRRRHDRYERELRAAVIKVVSARGNDGRAPVSLHL